MIIITEKAKNWLKKRKINSLYIYLKYVKGPCDDNLCKIIPIINVSTEPINIEYENVTYDEVKIFIQRLLAKKMINQKEYIIDFSILMGGLYLKGFTFSP